MKAVHHMTTEQYIARWGEGNHPDSYEELTPEEKMICRKWILTHLIPTRRGPLHSSYGLKHVLERDTGLYVDNGQFKGCMEDACIKAHDVDDINWTYRVRIIRDKQEEK